MTWVRRGLIFRGASHAQVPTALVMLDRIRIFYADRTSGQAFIAYVDLERDNPQNVMDCHLGPVMPLGEPGTFDSDGMMPSCIVENDGHHYLFYSGWNAGVGLYRNSTGVAVSDDGGTTWQRMFSGPILDRTPDDPILSVTPWVIKDGRQWRMWYVSGLRWEDVEGKLEPVYVIKHATSRDLVTWVRRPHICIPQTHELEAFSRPCVVKEPAGYAMWFCSRHSIDYRDGAGAYQIGTASSLDGLYWTRTDERMDVGAGWDSTMTAYPCVVRVDGRLVMFYNGNGFGQTGVGWAEWQ